MLKYLCAAAKARLLVLLSTIALASCAGVPDNLTPVSPFDAQRYLGKWYEIARLDHRFERNLQDVTATYSLNDDGTIKVINRGFNTKKQTWSEAQGKAKFAEDRNTGYLKVSFFGPFYGSYVVVELADDYSYSMVTGPDRDYLWILSRTPTMDESTFKALLTKAQQWGFETSALINVEHAAR
ncbi:MAG TPA: lipocalin family protein [Marinagarivorans sp.]